MRKLSVKLILVLIISCFLLLSTTFITNAQVFTGVDQQPADRVIVYCSATYIDVWGSDNLSNGFFMARIRFFDLLEPGFLTISTAFGQVIADVNIGGIFDVRWVGGPYFANGLGDFAKTFSCGADFSFPIGATVGAQVNTTSNTTQSTTTQTTATNTTTSTNTTATTTATNTTTTSQCGTRIYTVQAGDNLFRLSLRFGTNVTALASCNGILNPALIYVGQRIYVP